MQSLEIHEVLDKTGSEREDAGIVSFQHYGVNQRDEVVFEGKRTTLIKRRSHHAPATHGSCGRRQ